MGEVQGRILEDEELIVTLDASKITSNTVNKRMKQSKITQEEISKTRESYRVAARRGSVLYFAISDLSLIDPMYQYSLEFFIRFFKKRLENSEQSEDLESRLGIIIEDITVNFYKNICRGLFEKDKLLYSFLITVKINLNSGEIDQGHWNFFLRGSPEMHEDENYHKPDFISEVIWQNILNLSNLHPDFTCILDSF
jgi:dynein heavy chain, axonemal